MPLYLFLILSTIVGITIQANSQCSFTSTPTSLSPFPTTNYLSYNESAKFVLDNYFTGINLSFSYNLSDVGEPQPVQKTLEYTNGYLLDALPQLAQSQIIDVYWDDSNVTSVAQQWTSDSLLLFLTEANSIYTLIVGSFDNIQASNLTDTSMYSSIIIQPPEGSSPGSLLQCSKITPVGELQYYIDCVLTDNSTGTVDNYFYYISFPGYPPSDYNVTAVLNTMTLQYSPIISSRVIVSATNNNCTYLVRYYNGLLLPSSTQINTTIEVFNVTDPLTPNLTINYNISMPGFAPTANISSLQVSANFMYIASAQGNIIIVDGWYTYPIQGPNSNVIQQYAYDEMTFQTTNLRVTSFGGQTKESFIAIGVLNSVNLTALLFVSQTFQEFYTIPLPPFKQTTLDFEVYSVALGEDFAGISYSVSETFSDSACYYYAIADISFEQSSDCHTLWTFEKDSFISYSKMNPAADTDILFVLGMDNQYSNYSIFRPAFALYDMQESTNATLNIQSSGYSNTIDFSLVVMSPNDQCIYLDLDSSDNLEVVAFQTNSDYLVFLNQSIYGPELNFAIQSDAIASYNLYAVQQIASNYTIQEGNTFLSMHRKHVSAMKPLLLLENAGNKTNLRLGTIAGSSIFNITSINLDQEMFEYKDILGYYYVSGYDIFLYNTNGSGGGPTMLYLDVESYFLGNSSPGFNVDLDMFSFNTDIIKIALTPGPSGEIQAILISNTTMYVGAFDGNDPEVIAGAISTVGFPFPTYPAFTPATIQVHTAFPEIAFITTTAGNITYVIEYSGMLLDPSDDASEEEGSLQFNIIFALHEADSAQDVIVQPFTNNLFYIFPALNAIEHWDLSVVRSPFFRRNLDLYSYNLSVLTNSFVQKGSAFSSTTDTLYILAQGNNTDNLYVLVLKPTPANSYIVQAIELPFSLNSPQTIAIDVTETQNFIYGNLLGDILVVLIGSNYYFWEIHSTPYLTFPVRTTDFDEGKVNVEYSANFTVQNQWNTTQVPMDISIYQNEKQISTTYPEINITSTEVCSITFGISDFWSGTVYNFSIANPSANVSITPFMYFTQVSNFSMSEHVDAVLEMTQNTYYLTSDEIILVDNKDPTITHQVQIIGPEGCSMYIDNTETYGVAICGSVGAKGIYPFYLTNFFNLPCDFISVSSLQDVFIDANNSLIFLLMQAANGGNSNISVYNTDQSFCNLSMPIFVMQGWSFSGSAPNFGQFDVLVMSSTQVIHVLFVLDLNFGLRIINYASTVNLVAGVYSYSFEQLYQYLGPTPDPIEFCDIQLLQNECELDSFGTCNANLLLVAHNFHAVLLQIQFENSGLEMAEPQFVVFLVPSDYWIDDYEFSGDLLILLGRNITQPDPGLDMLAYNMSYTNWLENGLDTSDPTIYQVPMWVTPLVADAENCPEYPLVHPTISLQNDGEMYMLSFPNLQNQSTVNYNITSNITVSWTNDSVIEEAPINIVVANNFQEVVLPVMFMREQTGGTLEPVPSKKWFYIGCGMVGLGLLILALLAIWCYRKKYKNRIQYSRKLQKDPLRELMMY